MHSLSTVHSHKLISLRLKLKGIMINKLHIVKPETQTSYN